MAYARDDPVVASLSELGRSIRSATADALSRRRLDLQEQAQTGELQRERELAALRQQTQQSTGEATLLKTQSDVNIQQSQEARAQEQLGLMRNQDVRAGESHGLNMETGKQALTEARTLLPMKVSNMKTADIMHRASAGASAASTRAANIRAEMDQFSLSMTKEQYALAHRPMPVEEVSAKLEVLGPEIAAMFREGHKPGEVITPMKLELESQWFQKFYTPEFMQMRVTGINRQINDPNTPPDQLQKLLQSRRQIMEQLGKKTASGDEEIETAMVDNLKVLKRTDDPIARQKLVNEIDAARAVRLAMQEKGGRLPESGAGLKPELYNHFKDTLRPEIASQQGFMLGSVEDFLIEQGQRTRPTIRGPSGEAHEYITPNELYPKVAPTVKPATSEEWKAYLKADPQVDTQEKANAKKKKVMVEELHRRIGGDRQQALALIQGPAVAQAPAATPAAATPAPGQAQQVDQTKLAIARQLQQQLGREPTPEEVEARFQELLNPPGVVSSIREGMRTTRPSDLLGGSLSAIGNVFSPIRRPQQ